MADASARFMLPLLQPGQAQKELFHNEALMRIDMLLHAAVQSVALDTPPSAPVYGQCWIVGAAPTGAWTGRAHCIAGWTDGGWRSVAPMAGMRAFLGPDGPYARWDGATWGIESAVAAPTGGATIDAEARAAITAIIGALTAHGIIDT